MNLLIFQRYFPVLSLRSLSSSSCGLKKDYPWNDFIKKHPDPLFKCLARRRMQRRTTGNFDTSLGLFFQCSARFKVANIEHLTTSATDPFARIGFSCSSLFQYCSAFRTPQVEALILISFVNGIHDNFNLLISNLTMRPALGRMT